MEVFPEFDPAPPLNEDEMKNKDGKEKWRKFMMKYEKTVRYFPFVCFVVNILMGDGMDGLIKLCFDA